MALAGFALVLVAIAMFVPWATVEHAGGEAEFRVWRFEHTDEVGITEAHGWTSPGTEGEEGRVQIRIGGPLLAVAAATCLVGIFLTAGGRGFAAGSALAVGAAVAGAGIALVMLGVIDNSESTAYTAADLSWGIGLYAAITGGAAIIGACVAGFLMPPAGSEVPEPGIHKAEPKAFIAGLEPPPGMGDGGGHGGHGGHGEPGAFGAEAGGEPRTFTAMTGPTEGAEPDVAEEPAPAAKPATAAAGKPVKPAQAAKPAVPSAPPSSPAKPVDKKPM